MTPLPFTSLTPTQAERRRKIDALCARPENAELCRKAREYSRRMRVCGETRV